MAGLVNSVSRSPANAVGVAAVKFKAVEAEKVGDLIALDIALRRDDRDWFERFPPPVADHFAHHLYHGHFLCYALARSVDLARTKQLVIDVLDRRGAWNPAEHNVGYDYTAASELVAHSKRLDPGSRFNPGICRTAGLRGSRAGPTES